MDEIKGYQPNRLLTSEPSRNNRATEPIREKTTLGRAQELLNWIATLEQHKSVLFGDLFGMGENGDLLKRNEPTNLDSMIADACTRVASLCGDLSTLRNRLGCSPDTPKD